MAEFKKAKVVDGYSLVRAMAHAAEGGGDVRPRLREAGAEASAAPRPAGAAGAGAVAPPVAGSIGKTIQPTRRTIRCFSCGYEFQLSGSIGAIYCSKCREKIDLGDVVVDGERHTAVRTGGMVHVKPGGVVKSGVQVMAGNVLLEGRLESGAAVTCTQWLEIGPGAEATPRQLETRNLRIGPGAEWAVAGKLQVHHLEVLGTLEANVESDGVVTVRAGGHLKGTVRGAHLQVEEGAALEARMFIWGPERA